MACAPADLGNAQAYPGTTSAGIAACLITNAVRLRLWAAFWVVALLIPVTLFGLASMGIAMLIHEGAAVLVVLNALRLLRFVDAADPRLTQLKEGALTHGPQKA